MESYKKGAGLRMLITRAKIITILSAMGLLLSSFSIGQGKEQEEKSTETYSREDVMKVQEAVKADLASKKDDPCYDCLLLHEFGKRFPEESMKVKTSCIPVLFHNVWEIRQEPHGKMIPSRPPVIGRYLVEERYPGCLKIMRHEYAAPSIQLELTGPLPQEKRSEIVTGGLREASNKFPIYRKRLFGDEESTAETKDPGNFNFLIGGGFSFSAGPAPVGSQLLFEVPSVIPKRFYPEPWVPGSEVPRDLQFTEFAVNDYSSVHEVLKGVNEGRIIWKIPFSEAKVLPVAPPVFPLIEGTATFTLTFNPQKGKMEVTPPRDLVASGPDEKCQYAPLSQTYTLKNPGDVPIKYSISKTAGWLDLNPKEGTIDPWSTVAVTVSIKQDEVKRLGGGPLKDTVRFTNLTDGAGNTSRDVVLKELQIWAVKITGFEVDDLGGYDMFVKMDKVWKYLTVDYGVRFDYKLAARVTVAKTEGGWKYERGEITDAEVKYYDVFDTDVFHVTGVRCRASCGEVSGLKGQPLSGDATDGAVHLRWPNVRTRVEVNNQLKLKVVELVDKSRPRYLTDYSLNSFESEEFLDYAGKHDVPLKEGHWAPPPPVKKDSYKDQWRPDKRKPIRISYEYFLMKLNKCK